MDTCLTDYVVHHYHICVRYEGTVPRNAVINYKTRYLYGASMISRQGDGPKAFYFHFLNIISYSLHNYLAREGGGSVECAATATAKVEIWMARSFCRLGFPALLWCGAKAAFTRASGEINSGKGANLLVMLLLVVVILVVVVVVVVTLPMSMAMVFAIFGFRKKPRGVQATGKCCHR